MKLGVTALETNKRLFEAFSGFNKVLNETAISFAQLGISLLVHKRRQRWYNKIFNRKCQQ